jgi:type VI secretion system secreted protein VgrG
MALTQDNRLIAVDTPLGKDVLLLTGFSGTEEISRLFSFELEMISENHSIPFEKIIGQPVTVSMVLANGKRYFNGIVSRFSQSRGGGETGPDPRVSFYTATVVPWLWLLTRTADSRIFQKQTVPEIVEKIFKEKGFKDYKFLLDGTYRNWDYCVQYRETDFNFVSRILEEEGIFYFFKHENRSHKLIIGNSNSKFNDCPNQPIAKYHTTGGTAFLPDDRIHGLEHTQEIRAGKYTLKDFNFEIPNTDLESIMPSKKPGPGEREVYDYPGSYLTKEEGGQLAQVRMEEEEAQITSLVGTSGCRPFSTGFRFTLQDYYRKDLNNKPYILTSLHHQASQGADYPGVAGGSDLEYSNHFTCMPFEVPYRPLRITPKPVVEGVQTAIVVGPAGQEIYTDPHGRVKVQFHWDREGKKNENSSFWIRVSQLWAGSSWGAMYIPRIGHEVIVDFLEGDPDQPIIIGRVYHGQNRPPYVLPDEKTKSTIKSDSSIGGEGSNEIRFEDRKGKEELYIHAQHDFNQVVENDQTDVVHNNRTSQVDRDDSETVGNNQTLIIGKNQSITIASDHILTVGSNQTVSVGANRTIQVVANQSGTIGGTCTTTITGPLTITCGANATFTVGSGLNIISGGTVTINAPSVVISAGTISLNTAMLQVAGVVQCATLMTSAVVSASYTPGVGNIV